MHEHFIFWWLFAKGEKHHVYIVDLGIVLQTQLYKY